MSYSINSKNNTITLTRGDTFICDVKIRNQDGDPYTPAEDDVIRFALKHDIKKEEKPLILKEISIDTMQLRLEPDDTKNLQFGVYYYDIEITRADGIVDTFITKTAFILTEEVY